MMKAFWWLRRFAGNFWYYWVSRGRHAGNGSFPFDTALELAFNHTNGWPRVTEPAWGGEIKDYD
jgi:hypothetical protein